MNKITKSHSSKYIDTSNHETVDSPDVHFEPVVKLALIETQQLEDEEDVLLSLQAKLFRYDLETVPASWKERGTGQCQILKHKASGLVRILMRRDNTLQICANHYIYPYMELKPNCGSDRAWVWSTVADFAEAKSKEHILAIRFSNSTDGKKFKSVFDSSAVEMKKILQARKISTVKEEEKNENNENHFSDAEVKAPEKAAAELTGQLKGLKVTPSSIPQLASA
ncbi:hypothetical protein BsWGS_07745 [Bradybaena similaris]